MTEQKRRYRTTIAGREYTILAKKPVEHLDVVSEIVNNKIEQINEAMPALDIEQQSVLVSINAVSESIEKQEEIDCLKKKISDLEKENEHQNQQVDQLENSNRKQSAKTKSKERQTNGDRDSSNQKKSSSHFVRPTTVSGVVLHRENMNQQKQNKEIPPYSKKKREIQYKQSNESHEGR